MRWVLLAAKILVVWLVVACLIAPVVIRLFRFSSAPETTRLPDPEGPRVIRDRYRAPRG